MRPRPTIMSIKTSVAAATPASPASEGCCGCCGLAVAASPDGRLAIAYRTANDSVHRDMNLIFKAARVWRPSLFQFTVPGRSGVATTTESG